MSSTCGCVAEIASLSCWACGSKDMAKTPAGCAPALDTVGVACLEVFKCSSRGAYEGGPSLEGAPGIPETHTKPSMHFAQTGDWGGGSAAGHSPADTGGAGRGEGRHGGRGRAAF